MTEEEHDSAAAEGGNDGKHRARDFSRRPAVRIGIVLVAVLLIVALVMFGVHSHRFESTDDAFVDARIVRLSPQIAGSVVHVYVGDNELVRAGQHLVDIDDRECVRASTKPSRKRRSLTRSSSKRRRR